MSPFFVAEIGLLYPDGHYLSCEGLWNINQWSFVALRCLWLLLKVSFKSLMIYCHTMILGPKLILCRTALFE